MTQFFTGATPSATRMIRADHTAVLAQFHKLEPNTQGPVRSAIVRNICNALDIHARLEEELFYPALRSAGLSSPELDKSLPEHEEMHRLIERVRSTDEASAAQTDALSELMSVVMHHMADEEARLLPLAEQQIAPEVLSDLGGRMTRRRAELARPHAAEMAMDMAVAAPMKTAVVAAGTLVAGALLYNRLRRGLGMGHNGMGTSSRSSSGRSGSSSEAQRRHTSHR